MSTRAFAAIGIAAALAGAVACSETPSAPPPLETGPELLSVSPAGGSTGVSVGAVVTIEFSHPMMAGMEKYAALHEGDVTGPVVAGAWSWSADRTKLTFTPAAPLKPQTRYTIHLGGGMTDAGGHPVNYDHHGGQMGGHWTGSTSGGGHMGGGSGHMGSGWTHANGTYGMIFTFTTA